MHPEYGQRYRELYRAHWWWRSREAAVLSVLRRNFVKRPAVQILDIGCGDGLFFDALSEFGEVEGVEPSAGLLNKEGKNFARIYAREFDASFQPGKRYDLILMLDVLEHLPDPSAALRHAASLLNDRGALLLTVPAFLLLWTNHDVMNHHRARYRRKTLHPLLRDAGLHVVKEAYWFQWTCPIKLIRRAAERVFHLEPRVPSVPPRWMNLLLEGFSRCEREIAGRLHIPFGSSLMAYCRAA